MEFRETFVRISLSCLAAICFLTIVFFANHLGTSTMSTHIKYGAKSRKWFVRRFIKIFPKFQDGGKSIMANVIGPQRQYFLVEL